MAMFIKNIKYTILVLSLIIFGLCFINHNTAQAEETMSRVIEINNTSILLHYINDVINKSGKKVEVYTDSQFNQWILENDKVVGYKKNKNYNVPISIEDFSEKYGISYLKTIPVISENVNLDNYTLDSIGYSNDCGEATYTFSRYINDLKTNDGVYITLNEDGSLASYSAPRQGLFDNLITDVTAEDVEKYIDSEIKRIYNISDYTINYMYIDYSDSKYYVYSTIGLQYDTYRTSVEVIFNL